MDLPIYAATKLDRANKTPIRYEVFSRFFRLSVETTGAIIAEFGAAHVVREPDWSRWPWPIPAGGVPAGSVMLDRYGGAKASRHGVTPVGILNTPERRPLLLAVLSMRSADVSHMQRDDNGCGAAVMARLVGIDYAEAVRKLYPSGIVRVLGTSRLADATCTTRHVCKRKTWEEVEKAGAVAALIRHDGAKWGHYVAIEPGMVIVDPELVLHYPLAEYPRKAWTPQMYFVRD